VSATPTIKWFSFSVRVNGIEFAQVAVRSYGEQAKEFEIIIRDHHLGAFALHEEFFLEIPDGDQAISGWHPVSFSGLMSVVWTVALMLRLDVVEDKISSSSFSLEPERPSRCRIERIPVAGDSSHLDRLHRSLQLARIRYQIVGGLDSRGRGRGHLTVAVSSLVSAGVCLQRAGFFESPESKYVLVDSSTGWKVRLLEAWPGHSKQGVDETKLPKNRESI
jgi:hypothetical protein